MGAHADSGDGRLAPTCGPLYARQPMDRDRATISRDLLRALEARIYLVHVKDARRRDDGWELVPLGEGEVPVRESLAALRAAGYDGWLTVEWEKRWHPELAEPEVALPRDGDTLKRWLG